MFGIVELDAAQMRRVILAGLGSAQCNGLVATQSRGLVYGTRVDATKEQIGFGSRHKECLRLMHDEPAREVGEAPIHDVKAAGFGYQDVEHIDLVHLAVADVDEGWNIAAQVEQRMHLDGRFGLTKARPRKDAQAQVDSCGIGRIGGLFQFDRKAVVDVELSGSLDQAHREILIDAPVAGFVGIGQRALGDVATDAQVIKLGVVSAQTGFYVAQALAVRQLGKSHAEKLVEMRKRLGRIFGGVTLHTAAKCVKG